MLTCSKTYRDIPFAHRQHQHDGHCALIHGHNWAITLTFACRETDANGFVVDFSDLKYLKTWIAQNLDHACLLMRTTPRAMPCSINLVSSSKLTFYPTPPAKASHNIFMEFLTRWCVRRQKIASGSHKSRSRKILKTRPPTCRTSRNPSICPRDISPRDN